MHNPNIPDGWKLAKISNILKRVRIPVDLKPDEIYREIGIRSHGKGLFHKDESTGESIGNKRVFWIEPDCFVVNIVFAWEQAVAKTTETEKGMIASHRFPMYKPIAGKLDLDYILYFFKTPYGKHLLGLASPGGAGRNKTLGQKEFDKLSLPLPPYPEQRKIAEILSTWDEAIAKSEQLIAALQARKKGLMQRLLTGEVRFPGFVQFGEMQETKFGDIPVDWTIARIEKVAKTLFSNVDKKTDSDEMPVRLCNYMDVFKNLFITDELQFMEASANQREIDKFTLQKDDVIITKDSEVAEEIAEATVVAEELRNVICGYHLAILRPKQKVLDGTFLMYLLHYPSVQNQFARLANGITRFGLTIDSVNHALVIFPSLPEQQKIASVLKSCDDEMALLQQKLNVLQQQKKGLMQRLLTGEVRVKPERFPNAP